MYTGEIQKCEVTRIQENRSINLLGRGTSPPSDLQIKLQGWRHSGSMGSQKGPSTFKRQLKCYVLQVFLEFFPKNNTLFESWHFLSFRILLCIYTFLVGRISSFGIGLLDGSNLKRSDETGGLSSEQTGDSKAVKCVTLDPQLTVVLG